MKVARKLINFTKFGEISCQAVMSRQFFYFGKIWYFGIISHISNTTLRWYFILVQRLDSSYSAQVDVADLSVAFAGAQGEAIHAVQNLSLTMFSGEIFALLGHNGAGKTTTINVAESGRRLTRSKLLAKRPHSGGLWPGKTIAMTSRKTSGRPREDLLPLAPRPKLHFGEIPKKFRQN